MSETIRFTIDSDGVALVEIDLPGTSMNVLNEALLGDLVEAIEKVNNDDAIVGAVITSGKKDFLAGADLRMLQALMARKDELGPAGLYAANRRFNSMLRKLETSGHSAVALVKGEAHAKPVVAAISGQALGGGCEVTLACHARVCTPDAKFGQPEVKVGLLPGAGGTQRLPRMIGIQSALQYLTTGKNIRAGQALKMGIVDAIVEAGDLVSAAKAKVLEMGQAVQPWDRKGFRYPGGGGAMHPGSVQTFIGANAMARGQTFGNYPAVEAILSCVYEGSILPMDRAVEVESKYFTKLMLGPEAGAMIRSLFVNKLAAEKGARRPKDVPPLDVRKVGILGAGLMGAGVAHESAKAGMEVVLLDRDDESAARGKAYSERLVKKGMERGYVKPDAGEALLSRIHPTTDYADLEGCDLIIEAVFEHPDIKADVTKKTEAVVGADTVFGSNTSTLPITDLQQNWSKPDNFIGIHFFSPVEKMPLVEMILGRDTGDKALAAALDYTRKIRKTPIVVNDSRGFYTSRCVGIYNDESGYLISEGVSPALIENCGRMAGYPMGPLRLGDSVNIDLMVKITRQSIEALGDEYTPGPIYDIAVRMTEEFGRLGMKNGKGFYEYEEGSPRPTRLWPGLAEAFPVSDDQPEPQEVMDRLLYRQVIECVRCFDEGVLTRPEEGDLGAIFGWGFPPFTGGPFSFIDTVGLQAFVDKCDSLAAQFGERFTPPPVLREMAREGRQFYSDEALDNAA